MDFFFCCICCAQCCEECFKGSCQDCASVLDCCRNKDYDKLRTSDEKQTPRQANEMNRDVPIEF